MDRRSGRHARCPSADGHIRLGDALRNGGRSIAVKGLEAWLGSRCWGSLWWPAFLDCIHRIWPRIWCCVAASTNTAGMLQRAPTFPSRATKCICRPPVWLWLALRLAGRPSRGVLPIAKEKKKKKKKKTSFVSKSDFLGVCCAVPLGLGSGHARQGAWAGSLIDWHAAPLCVRRP